MMIQRQFRRFIARKRLQYRQFSFGNKFTSLQDSSQERPALEAKQHSPNLREALPIESCGIQQVAMFEQSIQCDAGEGSIDGAQVLHMNETYSSPCKQTQTFEDPEQHQESKLSLEAGSSKDDSQISQAQHTDKIINNSVSVDQSMLSSVFDSRIAIRLISGDEKLNLTMSAALSNSHDQSVMLNTGSSLLEKNPFSQYTFNKFKDLLAKRDSLQQII